MWEVVKKYWDIIVGTIAGIAIAFMEHLELEVVQLTYSIIILILVSIGILRMVRQTVETRKERKNTVIDNIVDGTMPVKAVDIAANPTKGGEKIGKNLVNIMKGVKSIMKKIKELFDKYKGYLLTIALGVLSLVEDYGGYINQLFGDKLMIRGYEVLPIVTLVAAIVVGILSNGYTKEQKDKIKALFSKSSTSEIVKAEIKATIKEDNEKLAQYNKALATQEAALENLKSELARKESTHAAKKEMFAMIPQLATADDVQLAANEVVNTEAQIAEKAAEIEQTRAKVENLKTTIAALKSQL